MKNIIIGFLLGMVFLSLLGLKIPDIQIPDSTDVEVKELLEDYILPVINTGQYQLRISSSEITSSTALGVGVLTLDDSSSTRYLVISNGTTNYRVALTAL